MYEVYAIFCKNNMHPFRIRELLVQYKFEPERTVPYEEFICMMKDPTKYSDKSEIILSPLIILHIGKPIN